MAFGKKFLGEGHALVPALGSRELQKLAHGEVPGMCGHEVEKASLVFGVAEAAKVGETGFRKVHRLDDGVQFAFIANAPQVVGLATPGIDLEAGTSFGRQSMGTVML